MRKIVAASGFILLLCSACDAERKDVPGVYVVKGLTQSTDTLRLLPSGFYKRTLYSNTGQVIYSNSNKWKYLDGDLILEDYLIDEDQRHSPEEILGTGSMTCFLPVRTRLSKTVIYYRHGGDDTFFYEKL